MKKTILKSATSLATIATLALAPVSLLSASAEDASFNIACPSEAVINSEFSLSVTCNSSDDFESLNFALTYDSDLLKVKTDEGNNPVWSVNTDAGDPNKDSIKIMDGENGIIYVMMEDGVSYHYLSLDLTFETIADGQANLELNVRQINKDSSTPITHSEPAAEKSITIKSTETSLS